MPMFRYTEQIDETPEAVFDFMMDFANASHWRSLVSHMEVVGGGPARAGADILVTFDIMGGQRQIVTHVIAVDRPSLFAFWNENDGMRGEFRYEVTPQGGGSRVDFVCNATPLSLSRWLLLPWIHKQGRARYADQLQRLSAAMAKAKARQTPTA